MAVPVLIGAATLDNDVLVDSLVPDVIDGLRDELHPAFGVRAYRVYRVIRTWTGRRPGEGVYTDDAAELRPQPRVLIWDGFRYAQAICGVMEIGDVKLTEISLTYTAGQLDPRTLTEKQELFIAIGEGNGQASPTRLWAHKMPPFIDREKDMGWVMLLHSIKGASWEPT